MALDPTSISQLMRAGEQVLVIYNKSGLTLKGYVYLMSLNFDLHDHQKDLYTHVNNLVKLMDSTSNLQINLDKNSLRPIICLDNRMLNSTQKSIYNENILNSFSNILKNLNANDFVINSVNNVNTDENVESNPMPQMLINIPIEKWDTIFYYVFTNYSTDSQELILAELIREKLLVYYPKNIKSFREYRNLTAPRIPRI